MSAFRKNQACDSVALMKFQACDFRLPPRYLSAIGLIRDPELS